MEIKRMKSMISTPFTAPYTNNLRTGLGQSVGFASPAHQIQELNEAIFLSQFTCAVIATLDPDSVCASAARQLYDYTPYRMIVFRLTPEAGGKTISYAPSQGRREPTVLPFTEKQLTFKAANISFKWDNCQRLELPSAMGCIEIWPTERDKGGLSDSFRDNLTSSFAMALQNAVEHSRVKEMAMQDGLTGLFNRRTFDEMLNLEGRKELLPLSLLLIDLDDFKLVNDRYGHQAGDQVLARFGRLLKESFRGTDLLARYGGEEFAVLLPKTPVLKAAEVAQRLLTRLGDTTFEFEGQEHRVTASIGVAAMTKGDRLNVHGLVERADQALYKAKRGGKNRLVSADTPAPRGDKANQAGQSRLPGL
jgi:diguanylate cyclase (GGDEF)-like protein